MRANLVMSRDVVTVAADASVYDAAMVLLNAGISAAPVIDAGGKMIGIISEADLMHRPEIGTVPRRSWIERLLVDDAILAKDFIRSHSHRVADVMTREVVTAGPRAPLPELAALMQRHKIKRIPIVDGDKVIGIVSRANLLQGLLVREPLDASAPDNDKLRAAVLGALAKHGWASSGTANVVAENGVVHLWGWVDSTAAKKAYEVASENVPGVQRVKNHMMILPFQVHLGV